MLTLHKLQDGMYIYSTGEKAQPSERVVQPTTCVLFARLTLRSAKYIEGLENRLGRMESLLRLSGLLGGEDDGRTDLGTLERRLADNSHLRSTGGTPTKDSASTNSESQTRTHQSPEDAPQVGNSPNPMHSPRDQPSEEQRPKEKEEAVEELSDMMCSLVTNNCGESRYIGTPHPHLHRSLSLTTIRIIFWLFDILTKRYTMGQREDW